MIYNQPYIDAITKLCQYVVMDSLSIISKRFSDRPFKLQELVKAGVSRQQLRTLCKNGVVEKVSHGLYQLAGRTFGNSAEELYCMVLNRIGKPSCICLLSALEYYNLTDQISQKIWVMVPDSTRVRARDIRLFRCRHPKWGTAISKLDGFLITTVERTIIEALIYRRHVGLNTGIEALKKALREKKTTLKKIAETAIALNVYKRIRPIIEVLV